MGNWDGVCYEKWPFMWHSCGHTYTSHDKTSVHWSQTHTQTPGQHTYSTHSHTCTQINTHTVVFCFPLILFLFTGEEAFSLCVCVCVWEMSLVWVFLSAKWLIRCLVKQDLLLPLVAVFTLRFPLIFSHTETLRALLNLIVKLMLCVPSLKKCLSCHINHETTTV